MKSFILGLLFGIVISTVGFSGIAKLIDNGVDRVKQVTVEQAK